jgi:hypothetical protein
MWPTAEIKEEAYHQQHRRYHAHKKSISNHGIENRHGMTKKTSTSKNLHKPCLHRRVTDTTADPPLSTEDIDIPFVVTVAVVGDTTNYCDDVDNLSEISYEEEDYHLFERSSFAAGMEDDDELGFPTETQMMLDSSTTTPSLGATNRWGMTTLCLEEGSIAPGILERHGGVAQLSDSVIQELLVSKSKQQILIGEF